MNFPKSSFNPLRVLRTPLCVTLLFLCAALPSAKADARFFEIQVLDDVTQRGVPLVELETVNHRKFLTDSAGRIAFSEPSFENEMVWFSGRSDGYEFPKDGFGMRGARVRVRQGGREILRIRRLNIAERLYRITGEGIYRDSVLLGYNVPIQQPLLNAQVLGQDSIQRVIYHGQVHWFWGDTLRMSYPLGNFRMSGAVSDLPGQGGLAPGVGINLRYFTNEDGFCKGMFPIKPEGDLIWADGFLVLPNETGGEQMLAHYQRLKGLGKPLAHGIALYDDAKNDFEKMRELDFSEKWRFPHGHPIALTNEARKFFYFGTAFPNVRVPADADSILEPSAYEAFTCLKEGSSSEMPSAEVSTDATGKALYRWAREIPPITPQLETELISAGKLQARDAHFHPLDSKTGSPVLIHGGTVNWNPWRRRWILIAVQQFGTSMLGEIWYGEADAPTGPWRRVVKIATHDRYSFYNPAHHPFLDEQGGRSLFFEGTYTAEFSGNSSHTASYDYNQIMYRLDLEDPRLQIVDH